MTAPAAASPRRTPFNLKRSTTPRKAAVSMSSLLALAYAPCALAKGIRTPPMIATRLTAEPTSIDPPLTKICLENPRDYQLFHRCGHPPWLQARRASPSVTRGAILLDPRLPPNGPPYGRIHHDNGARWP